MVSNVLDSGFHRSDDFLRFHHNLALWKAAKNLVVGLVPEPDYLVVGFVFFNAPQLAAGKFTSGACTIRD